MRLTHRDPEYRLQERLLCGGCMDSICGNISEHLMKWGKELVRRPVPLKEPIQDGGKP